MTSRTIRVRLSTAGGESLFRQSPAGEGKWGNVTFDVTGHQPPYDWWIVCHSTALTHATTTTCDPNHVVYCSMEPEDWVSDDFLRQFSMILSADPSHRKMGAHPLNVTTWWVGHDTFQSRGGDMHCLNYEALRHMEAPKKHRRISVVSSGKRVLPGHERRFAFLSWLQKSSFGKHIDFFGMGFTPIADKWQAVEPYDFHIAIENSRLRHYWSEKISDAYLGFACPLYFGCPDVEDYFPGDSFRELDITSYSRASLAIERALDAKPSNDEFNAICRAREAVLDRFNIFAILANIANCPAKSLADVKLLPSEQLPKSVGLRLEGRASRTARRFGVMGSVAMQRVRNGS